MNSIRVRIYIAAIVILMLVAACRDTVDNTVVPLGISGEWSILEMRDVFYGSQYDTTLNSFFHAAFFDDGVASFLYGSGSVTDSVHWRALPDGRMETVTIRRTHSTAPIFWYDTTFHTIETQMEKLRIWKSIKPSFTRPGATEHRTWRMTKN